MISIESDEQFRNIGDTNRVLYFRADWCAPCRAMKPILDDISKANPSVSVYVVDVDLCPEAAKSHEIRAIPTFFIINEQNVIKHVLNGSVKKDHFQEHLDAYFKA